MAPGGGTEEAAPWPGPDRTTVSGTALGLHASEYHVRKKQAKKN